MALETGVVTRLGVQGAQTAWVRTERAGACESCSSRHSCHPFGNTDSSQEVEAINTAGARAGDRIQLSMHTGSLLKATFLLYLFPILCMLSGGFAGDRLAAGWHFDASTLAIIMALTGLAAAMLVVRVAGQRMARNAAYQPQIVRVLGHASRKLENAGFSLTCPAGGEQHR